MHFLQSQWNKVAEHLLRLPTIDHILDPFEAKEWKGTIRGKKLEKNLNATFQENLLNSIKSSLLCDSVYEQ